MKILNPTDTSASTPANPAAAEERPKSIRIDNSNASNAADFAVPESEMTEYDKAVVKSFQEAAEEERKETEANARERQASIETGSNVDVHAHVEQDSLLKSATGTADADKTVKVSSDQKDAFCTALITNERYTEKFTLFGGRISVTIRSRTLEETDSIEAYLRYQVASGMLRTSNDYSNLVRKILLAAQIQEFNGITYAPLKGPMHMSEDKDGRKMPGWEEQLDIWGRQSGAVAIALIRCITEFEARYWFMVDNAKDTNFWNRGESTAE